MNKQKAIKLMANGLVVKCEFNEGESYEFLKDTVEGWLECVNVGNGIDMWLNEEGKLIQLPINYNATRMWERKFGLTDIMVGNAVLTSSTEDGETVGLTDEQMEYILDMVRYPEPVIQFIGD